MFVAYPLQFYFFRNEFIQMYSPIFWYFQVSIYDTICVTVNDVKHVNYVIDRYLVIVNKYTKWSLYRYSPKTNR